MLHDEVCIYLVVVLVFVYWMLYSILMDHIFFIKTSSKNCKFLYKTKDDFTFFEYILLNFFSYLNNIEQFLLNKQLNLVLFISSNKKESLSLKFLNNLISIINYLKIFLLFFEGFQYSNMKFIYNFYYIVGENNNLNLNYNLNNKLLFSGCDSNILSVQGKFIEMEDTYLLSNLSYDLFIVDSIQFIYKIYSHSKFKDYDFNKIDTNKWVSSIIDIDFFLNYYGDFIFDMEIENLYNWLINYNVFNRLNYNLLWNNYYNLLDFQPKKNYSISNKLTIGRNIFWNSNYYFNKIISFDFYFQESFYYKRRFIKYHFIIMFILKD